MRSHPYTPPPAFPPILDELATMLPIPRPTHRSRDDSDIPLDDIDSETGQLIPVKKRTHRVWVQGKLAAVRSVSANRVKSRSSLHEQGVSGLSGRRRSTDDVANIDDEEEEKETSLRAKQLRGYGIGGVGNIRRPTDVIYGPQPSTPSIIGTKIPDPSATPTNERPRWNLRKLLALKADDKGKSRVL